jgi:hypothetical protein
MTKSMKRRQARQRAAPRIAREGAHRGEKKPLLPKSSMQSQEVEIKKGKGGLGEGNLIML